MTITTAMNVVRFARSDWAIRFTSAGVVCAALGGSACWGLVFGGNCGTQQEEGALSCPGYFDPVTGLAVLCGTFPEYITTPTPINNCQSGYQTGGMTCSQTGSVYAKKQKYKCESPGTSCNWVADGRPENTGSPCSTGILSPTSCVRGST